MARSVGPEITIDNVFITLLLNARLANNLSAHIIFAARTNSRENRKDLKEKEREKGKNTASLRSVYADD